MASRKLIPLIRRNYSTKKAIFLTEKQLLELDQTLLQDKVVFEEIAETTIPHTRGSEEAAFGRKRIGCVELPKPLIKGITDLIEEQDKRLIRTDALRLYDALRSTTKIAKESEQNEGSSKRSKVTEPHKISYGPRESAAYAAGVLPSTYAAIYNVLQEVSSRLPNFKPLSVLDFGTGPGTAIWASKEVFNVKNCVGIDLSEDMLRVAEQLEASMKSSDDTPVEFKRYLAFDPKTPQSDLVVSAFTLGDISTASLQKSAIEQLWARTGDTLVLIDRGTPIGFSNIARARQWVLDMEEAAHVVAPCSHDRPCPLLFSPMAKPEKFWCHFSQRVQRPTFLMKTKHSKQNAEDSKYSYVVIRRGRRPTVAADSAMESAAYEWPRIIQPPLKNKGHIVIDVCSKEGEIQRMTIPKSQGKIPYHDARKAAWGDLFPHNSKNKVITRVSKGEIELVEALNNNNRKK